MAGLMLIIGGCLLAFSASCWWMQRVAFAPTASIDSAYAILDDDAIRGEVATVIAVSAGPSLSQSPTELKEFIEGVARIRDGAALMAPFIKEAHQRVIGERDDPVTITAAQQVTIVRDEQAALGPSVTLTVQEVGSLTTFANVAWWLTAISAVLGVLALAAGLLFRPERGEGLYALGVTLGAFAGLMIVLGYLVPLALLPAFSESPWMGIFPRLANEHRLETLLVAAVSAGISAFVLLRGSGQRRGRQWSTPLGVGRRSDFGS
jgi:hypothetical protein